MTTRVLVMSDTHGVLRPSVLEAAQLCRYIIHAGDFDDDSTYDTLDALAPLCAVRGNNDWYLRQKLPVSTSFKIEDVRFFVVHDRTDALREMQPRSARDFDVVVFGHSHRYYEKHEDGVLWLNPGSCGRRRFGGSLSFAWLTVDGRSVTVERVDLLEAGR